MTPLKVMKAASAAFEKLNCKYCLIGGHAASLYRSQERFTKDVDFAVLANNQADSRVTAEQCLLDIGLEPVCGFIPLGAAEFERDALCFISSAPATGELKGVIDIFLPEMPWVVSAIIRAQNNKLDLGFANVPVITPEDLIVAKCYAYRNTPDRFQDLDDINQLLNNLKNLDLDYLDQQLRKLNLKIPEIILSPHRVD